MTARKTSAASAASKAAKATVIDNDTQEVEQAQSRFSDAYAAFNEAMAGGASPKNNVLRFVAKVLLYAVGFTATIVCIGMLSTAMLAGGWPLFTVMFMELIGYIFGWYGALLASELIVDFIADGKLVKAVDDATGWLVSKFSNTSTFVKQTMDRTVH
jgi:type IV secretory pathway VirB2 component (pilin)